MAERKMSVVYVTSSEHKREENRLFVEHCELEGVGAVRELVEFDIRTVPIQEILDVDLRVMVAAEVVAAYSQLKVPCIVEHAGLIFPEYAEANYPGGLTKAMWNALKDGFVEETRTANRRVVARAVVGYCDGMTVKTFIGERAGRIAEGPRGDRAFYWDTVFIPDDPSGRARDLTYAEIASSDSLGLQYKVRELSQSSAAMKEFLRYRLQAGDPPLWQ